ncbi:cobalt-precorrin-6A reductase [Kaistia dalseonensis]|uniref:Precorrin-6A/cobalt-precorrin-6A reductase n=1 Tax=Kaistia dalseonensis TaxID=410840 RepID=A0ABU0HAH3_9HYPH|nr:cobalt-precorrin-6A reductase [Kaistia dalseonensis]MCX5496652.1 cobalt-precorrin-6A reductase [Kaistia dalseonensis]MDQ0439275.1 precorrin-6A/cobalt-precorrin-6A reductase [Kaistia dalseonensis]
MTRTILILGGTTEGRLLAERLAGDSRYRAILSLAGRTAHPAPQALPTRIGGFGGVEGLAYYIRSEAIDALVLATHPYAGAIAANVASAANQTRRLAILWQRAPWAVALGDCWTHWPSLDALADAVGPVPKRVFVTIGRQGAHAFERAPQHRYLFRSVDPIDPPLALPHADLILDRGPFDIAAEIALMQRHGIEVVVSKNSGGEATYAKIEAARHLGLPVMMLDRPPSPAIPTVSTLDEVQAWLDHGFAPKNRGE